MDNNMIFDPTQWANNATQQQGTPVPAACGQPQTDPVSNPQTLSSDNSTELEKVQAVCDQLLARGANIAESYDDWLKLGFALAHGLGSQGRDFFHNLSAQSTKYNEQACERKWNECLAKHDGRTTIATFYMMAQQAGVDMSELNRQFPPLPPLPPMAEIIQEYGNKGISEDSDSFTQVAEVAEVAETFSDSLDMEALPTLFREAAATQSDAEGKDKILLGSLTCLSGAMPGVYGVYDKRRVYPPFYAIVDAPPASDKGVLTVCRQLLMPIQQDIEQQNERAQEEYQQQMAAWLAQDKKNRSQTTPPQEPPYRSLFIAANSSATATYQALADNKGWGVTFETEADVLTQALKSDYGDYSSGLRAAFHHERISYNRRKDKEHVNIHTPRWAVLLTCTPGQIPSLFPSFENGLGSRFLFYNLPRRLNWRNVFEQNKQTLDDQFLELGQRYHVLFNELKARQHPMEFVFSKEQQQEFNKFFSELQLEQVSLLGDDLIACVRRLGLVCFRIAMVLTVVRQLDCMPVLDPLSQTLVCSDNDFHTAMTIVNCLINHTGRVYATLIRHDEGSANTAGCSLTAAERQFLEALPRDITTADCIEVGDRMNLPRRTWERYLSRFVNKYGIVVRIKNGHYRKRS